MLQVYLDPCTVNSRKVLAGLDLLGTQYELKHINYFTGEHKSPEYLKIVRLRRSIYISFDMSAMVTGLRD